jgi:hypothetical protein
VGDGDEVDGRSVGRLERAYDSRQYKYQTPARIPQISSLILCWKPAFKRSQITALSEVPELRRINCLSPKRWEIQTVEISPGNLKRQSKSYPAKPRRTAHATRGIPQRFAVACAREVLAPAAL